MNTQPFTCYLQSINLSTASQNKALYDVHKFLVWYTQDPINCTKKDIIDYLAYLKNTKKHSNYTRQQALTAIARYFDFLILHNQALKNPTVLLKIQNTASKKLSHTYTLEQLTQLCDDYYNLFVRDYDDSHLPKNRKVHSALARARNHVILDILAHQGIATSDLKYIRCSDVDLRKARITIQKNTRTQQRTIPLHAHQIGTLMYYLNDTRPQFLDYCDDNEQLFLVLPSACRKHDDTHLLGAAKEIAKRLKSLCPTFIKCHQLRASVITHWIQVYGLRKAQYLAGHKHINSTELYLPNDIEALKEDMNQFNPF